MVTAFHDDGSVDLDGTARVAAYLVDNGNDGVVVSGVQNGERRIGLYSRSRVVRAARPVAGG